MKCPHCCEFPSAVTQTTRPLDEGLEEGNVKRRLRKCRNCHRSFTTYEIHEDLFRSIDCVPSDRPTKLPSSTGRLHRKPLLVEDRTPSKPRLVSAVDKLPRKGKSK